MRVTYRYIISKDRHSNSRNFRWRQTTQKKTQSSTRRVETFIRMEWDINPLALNLYFFLLFLLHRRSIRIRIVPRCVCVCWKDTFRPANSIPSTKINDRIFHSISKKFEFRIHSTDTWCCDAASAAGWVLTKYTLLFLFFLLCATTQKSTFILFNTKIVFVMGFIQFPKYKKKTTTTTQCPALANQQQLVTHMQCM